MVELFPLPIMGTLGSELLIIRTVGYAKIPYYLPAIWLKSHVTRHNVFDRFLNAMSHKCHKKKKFTLW